MGWQQYVRQAEAQARRDQREAARRFREMERENRRLDKEAEKQGAANEFAQYENYLELVVSLHAECGDHWDWQQMPATPPPAEPQRGSRREAAAQAEKDTYHPGFFARLFGGATKRLNEMNAVINYARSHDQGEYETALAVYRTAFETWRTRTHLAPGVLRLDLRSCRDALSHAGAFDELKSFRAAVSLEKIHGDSATLRCRVEDPEIIPREELKLSAAGKLSSKEMAAGKYWGLYQDHVCSAAIRVARETFAVIPVNRAIVNVEMRKLNTSTGHQESVCILAVQFSRVGVGNLRLDKIDPSDAMKNFNHRMKFKKATGFDVVDEITDDDQWITT